MEKKQVNENYIVGKFDEGVESIIHKYMYDGDPNNIVLYKEFKRIIVSDEENNNEKKIIVSDETIENKRKKIEIIRTLKCLEDEVKILDSMYKGDTFSGYIMEQSNLKCTDYFIKNKKKIIILKLLREKIERLNSEGIFIGDISTRNILVSKDCKNIQLCDLDNFKIGDLDFDLPNLLVRTFNKFCSNKDLVDCYVFNLFTICFLERIYVPYILSYLTDNGLPRILNTKENRNILDSILHLDNSYQKKYLIDYMK